MTEQEYRKKYQSLSIQGAIVGTLTYRTWGTPLFYPAVLYLVYLIYQGTQLDKLRKQAGISNAPRQKPKLGFFQATALVYVAVMFICLGLTEYTTGSAYQVAAQVAVWTSVILAAGLVGFAAFPCLPAIQAGEVPPGMKRIMMLSFGLTILAWLGLFRIYPDHIMSQPGGQWAFDIAFGLAIFCMFYYGRITDYLRLHSADELTRDRWQIWGGFNRPMLVVMILVYVAMIVSQFIWPLG